MLSSLGLRDHSARGLGPGSAMSADPLLPGLGPKSDLETLSTVLPQKQAWSQL